MNPEQPINAIARDARYIRMIITIGLFLVLGAIVAAYIYYGMQFAQRDATEPLIPGEEEPVVDSRAIMEALESAPVASDEEARAIYEALESADSAPTADREAVLEALNHPTE